MMNKNNFDPDDIRNRGNISLHPTFYWRAIYDKKKDNYKLMPFMRINNGDGGHADWMEVAVTEKHTIRYRDEWVAFKKAQCPDRTEFTRMEMLNLQGFRDKYEYNKSLILLPPENPHYEELISDFSLKLTGENIRTLNGLDSVVGDRNKEQEQGTGITQQDGESRSREQKILDLLGMVADKLDAMDERITRLEHGN